MFVRSVIIATILLAASSEAWSDDNWYSGRTRPHTFRSLPQNASPLANDSNIRMPEATFRERCTIAREILTASGAELLRQPLTTAARTIGRSTERISGQGKSLFYRALPAVADAFSVHARRGYLNTPGIHTSGSVTLLPNSESSISALLCHIDSAMVQVDVLIYAWEDDPTGRQVARTLQEAAMRGVRVRVIIDRLSFLLHNPSAAAGRSFIDSLAATPGVEIIQPRGAMARFDHRKLVLIDGQYAWTGGMIFTHQARTAWDNISCLCEGPVVAQLRCLFNRRWTETGGLASDLTQETGCTKSGAQHITVVATDVADRSMRNAIYNAADTAKSRIVIENCYFTDSLLVEKLIAARRRGVDVHVLITLRGNIEIVNLAMFQTANRLLRGGVCVHLAPGMTHLKTMCVDHQWSYIGSGNFDDLSLRNNRELGLVIFGREFAHELENTVLRPHLAKASLLRSPLPIPRHAFAARLLQLWL